MGLLSTSDEALVRHFHDALYNVDATTGFGEITLRFQVSAKRIIAGEVSSCATIARGVVSTEDSVVRQLHR